MKSLGNHSGESGTRFVAHIGRRDVIKAGIAVAAGETME
jgi:hypothetical protein